MDLRVALSNTANPVEYEAPEVPPLPGQAGWRTKSFQ